MKRKASLSAFGRARRLPAWSRFAVPAAMAGVAVALVGCTVMPPSGPSVVALPPKGKSLTEFQQEDYACRDYAFRSTDSAGAAQGATANSVNSAALGTVGGAAAGALLGAAQRGSRRGNWRGQRPAARLGGGRERCAICVGRLAGPVRRGLRAMHDVEGQHDFAARLRHADVRPARLRSADVRGAPRDLSRAASAGLLLRASGPLVLLTRVG